MFMLKYYRNISREVFDLLLCGASGRLHLMRLARAALQAGDGASGLGFLLGAWELDPLNSQLAAQILAVAGNADQLPVPALIRGAVKLVAGAGIPVPGVARDPVKGCAVTMARLHANPDDLGLWRELLELAPMAGESDAPLACVHDLWPALLTMLLPLVEARLHVASGRGAEGMAGAMRAEPWQAMPFFSRMLATMRLEAGDRGGAMETLALSLHDHLWCVDTGLALHDLARGVDLERNEPDGDISVLIFSYNKRPDLERTLESLAESGAARLPVHVLDNGSTDSTGAMLGQWLESGRLPGLVVETLPVNVGAPAARNWLLGLEAVAGREFAVFVDDDVDLPADWLSRLGAAEKMYPEAGVWGCLVRDFDRPAVLQSADLTLLPGQGDAPFTVSDIHLQGVDLGQFRRLRPCLSVTGCCHLFRTAELKAMGGFDIRFSPTQFDDLDRDLRGAAAGRYAVCQGHLTIGHRKRTGGLVLDDAAGANARGNERKLFGKWGTDAVVPLLAAQRSWLMADLLEKTAWIEANIFG